VEGHFWSDLMLFLAVEGAKWLAVLFVVVLVAAVSFLLHLAFQLTRRWKRLKEAALMEADLIKSRKQGPKWDAQEILPGIWLGSFPAAVKDDELRRRNITHVISIGAEFTPVYPDQFSYLVAFAMDCPGQNILNYFPHTNRFIDVAISSGSAVLVHWYGPLSLSPSHSPNPPLPLSLTHSVVCVTGVKQQPSRGLQKRDSRSRVHARTTRSYKRTSTQFHQNHSPMHLSQHWLQKAVAKLGTRSERQSQLLDHSPLGSRWSLSWWMSHTIRQEGTRIHLRKSITRPSNAIGLPSAAHTRSSPRPDRMGTTLPHPTIRTILTHSVYHVPCNVDTQPHS